MARIQILELPEGAGDDRPPFALIIDQASGSTIDDLGLNRQNLSTLEAAHQNLQFSLAEQLGARTVLVFEETIDLPGSRVELEDGTSYPVTVKVEGDFEKFRQQVEEEILYAQGKVTRALRDA